MSVQKNIFHKEVKKRLMDMDMTQVQLAKELGIKSAYLNDILQGKRDGDKYIHKIVTLLNMDHHQTEAISN